MKAERRNSPRKEVSPLGISSLTSVDSAARIARAGSIIDASTTGILITVQRKDLIPKFLRNNLTLESLIGDSVLIHIDMMDLELSGKITRTKFLGRDGGFEIAIDYTDEAPLYWRECLVDLLPDPGEIE